MSVKYQQAKGTIRSVLLRLYIGEDRAFENEYQTCNCNSILDELSPQNCLMNCLLKIVPELRGDIFLVDMPNCHCKV